MCDVSGMPPCAAVPEAYALASALGVVDGDPETWANIDALLRP